MCRLFSEKLFYLALHAVNFPHFAAIVTATFFYSESIETKTLSAAPGNSGHLLQI